MSSPPSTSSKKKRGEDNTEGLVYKYPSFSNEDNSEMRQTMSQIENREPNKNRY